MSIPALKFPSNFVCPQCEMQLEGGIPVTKDAERGIFKNHCIVCGHCGTFLIVGDSTLERMTVKQFRALPTEMQRLLGITRARIEGKIDDKQNPPSA